MCEKCATALQKYWGNLPSNCQDVILWHCTAFLAGDGELVAKQLKDIYNRSGGVFTLALKLANEDLDIALKTK